MIRDYRQIDCYIKWKLRIVNELLSGNEAIARGAYESGVTVAAGYPGTPSTEILEAAVEYKPDIYCEWSPNEKVAFEMAAGASLAGARCIVTMKHVGLNVAADPLMTLAYIGTVGGFVACVADDPGMHSSQNEQDTRQYARFAKIPILEPSDSQEAKDFLMAGLEISEQFTTPVILRTTTRVSHSCSVVELGERKMPERAPGFIKNPPRYVPIPLWGRVMRRKLEERLAHLRETAERSPLNRIEWHERDLGIITAGVAYEYVREVFPDASVLKLGWSYPFPDALIREFASGVGRLLIVEELDDFLEEHVKALGIPCDARNYVQGIGELSAAVLAESRARMEGREAPVHAPAAESAGLPSRPPVLCAGCPHRGVFYALAQHDVVVTGDIGCYSLGVFDPLNRLDTILCMGAGISMAHGMQKAGEPKKVVGIVGDSTFFHSGMTALLDIAYNRGTSTIIVADNRTTAMTGHQEHPGTGRTLMGEKTSEASIEEIGRACGIKRVRTVNPYDIEATLNVISEELETGEASLIVSRAPCPLYMKRRVGDPLHIDDSVCIECRQCLDLGCPAIEAKDQRPVINEFLCGGCTLCRQVCPVGAISVE